MSPRVKVQIFGALRRQAGASHLFLELPPGATVADALAAAGIADRVDVWTLVNGSRAGHDRRLAEGAELVFFQPVGGG
ncbi:MAG: molybdopterin synthase sulfur carrier subunit [Deltaproteobacteria bacterium]|nr:MAG: molybdopterin synthase sulfur carrier subunit [Deltaproteobacteria bacterium]